MKQWLRKKTINFLVKNLYRGITEEDILQVSDNGVIIYKGQKLDRESKEAIASQAKMIDDSFIWKILSDEMIYRSEERMFKKSENYDGMLFGKAMLYNIEVLRKRIKYLKNIK